MPSIFVNFAKNNNFGCDQHCPFCEWSKKNFNLYYCPTKDDLVLFHNKIKNGVVWQISGGGDPLFNFNENWPRLKSIIDIAHSLGHKVVLLTRKIDVANNNYELLKNYIDSWYFSVGNIITEDLKELSNKIGVNKIHVNTVLNLRSDEEINWAEVETIIKQYEPYVSKITFRNNFIYPLKIESISEIESKFKAISDKAVFNLSSDKTPVLFLGKILTCGQIDRQYLNINNC